ncbi:unnamed protein product, partial [Hymenolepis diminuta]
MRFGFISAFSTGLLTYLMIPSEAPIQETASLVFLQSRLYLIATVAILSGLNDSLWSTQISALIGKAYPTYSDPNITAAAFALFKCIQSILSAVAFFYST